MSRRVSSKRDIVRIPLQHYFVTCRTSILTIEAPTITEAEDILKYFFFLIFLVKIQCDISCELSARQFI